METITHKGFTIRVKSTHCENEKCNCLLDENTRFLKVVKSKGSPDKLISSSLCIECRLKRRREVYTAKTREYKEAVSKYCSEDSCCILLTKDNCYTSKRTRLDGSVAISFFPKCKDCTHKKEREKRAKKKALTKKEKIAKVKKEKVVTLKKKLQKENVDPIKFEQPIIITPTRKLSGREQAMRVFEEQKRRAERTQKEINDEKNKYIEWGI